MAGNQVKDLMVPLDDYALLRGEATLLDAVKALEAAQTKLPAGRQPHRAVLVTDAAGKVVGKVGQLAFLKALEPKYDLNSDRSQLEAAGVGAAMFDSMREHARLFQIDLEQLCERARFVKLKEVMRPISESIDETATLAEAIHLLTAEQTLSLLVTRDRVVVGVLRLSDVFEAVSEQMKQVGS
ncbi:MAG: CBS domain-containing protein [bacterium]